MPQDVLYAVLRQLCSTRRAHSAKRQIWIDVMPFERDHLATSKALKLLDRVRRAIWIRHYSRRTEQADLAWIRRFMVSSGTRHPQEMGEPEIQGLSVQVGRT